MGSLTTTSSMPRSTWPIDVYGDYIEPAPVPALRQVTATAPPLFGEVVQRRMVDQGPPEPPQVDRTPFWWPLSLVVLMLAAVAVMVAPAGVGALTP